MGIRLGWRVTESLHSKNRIICATYIWEECSNMHELFETNIVNFLMIRMPFYSIKVLCLSPTYELAIQTGKVVEQMGKHCPEIQIGYAVRGERGIAAVDLRRLHLESQNQ